GVGAHARTGPVACECNAWRANTLLMLQRTYLRHGHRHQGDDGGRLITPGCGTHYGAAVSEFGSYTSRADLHAELERQQVRFATGRRDGDRAVRIVDDIALLQVLDFAVAVIAHAEIEQNGRPSGRQADEQTASPVPGEREVVEVRGAREVIIVAVRAADTGGRAEVRSADRGIHVRPYRAGGQHQLRTDVQIRDAVRRRQVEPHTTADRLAEAHFTRLR